MNRALKFRIWDTANKLWVSPHVYMIEFAWAPRIHGPFSLHDYFDIDEKHVVQQFSGLQDSNGQDIYEGDILKYERDTKVCVVRWSEPHEDNHPGFRMNDTWDQCGPCKIVGNICEHPELLN